MGVHSFFAGVGMGVADGGEIFNMILAILAHKWSEALTIGISFINADLEIRRGIQYMIFYAFITPLGILLGSLLRSLNNEFITGIAKALSAGTFLYIACSEIIVEEFSISKYKGIKYMFYLLGIIFVICLGFLEEDEDH